ncbi:hypothetical protein FOA52_012767 [Chlamydomonas sp. UWO 241]|nr:hypothetical protein FOA52_012767 [Chlamydomonas sp. UWO 241]
MRGEAAPGATAVAQKELEVPAGPEAYEARVAKALVAAESLAKNVAVALKVQGQAAREERTRMRALLEDIQAGTRTQVDEHHLAEIGEHLGVAVCAVISDTSQRAQKSQAVTLKAVEKLARTMEANGRRSEAQIDELKQLTRMQLEVLESMQALQNAQAAVYNKGLGMLVRMSKSSAETTTTIKHVQECQAVMLAAMRQLANTM